MLIFPQLHQKFNFLLSENCSVVFNQNHHDYYHFTSVSLLAWVGRGFLDGSLQASQFWVKPICNLNFLKLSLINWLQVLHGLPLPLWPSTSVNLQLLTRFSISIYAKTISVFFDPKHLLYWQHSAYLPTVLMIFCLLDWFLDSHPLHHLDLGLRNSVDIIFFSEVGLRYHTA